DTLGYDMVGIADTLGIAMDPWVATTLLAEGTRRARVAVCVTNLVTRHPAVAAASIASVDLLAPGRAVLGVGVGHRGTRNLGAPSLPASELRGRGMRQGAPARAARFVSRRHRPPAVGEAREPGLPRGVAPALVESRRSPRRRGLHQLRPRR